MYSQGKFTLSSNIVTEVGMIAVTMMFLEMRRLTRLKLDNMGCAGHNQDKGGNGRQATGQ